MGRVMKSAKLSTEPQKEFFSATDSLPADRGKNTKNKLMAIQNKAIDQPSDHKIKWRL